MSEVFISYARSTADQAQTIAEALRALGYGVWRDDELPAHRAYADVIEERLGASRAVVVVWSAEAVKSQWVRSEAERARSDGKLVQLSLDGAPLPMPFDQIQCPDLSGGLESPGWKRVVESLAELTRKERIGDEPAPGGAAAQVNGEMGACAWGAWGTGAPVTSPRLRWWRERPLLGSTSMSTSGAKPIQP